MVKFAHLVGLAIFLFSSLPTAYSQRESYRPASRAHYLIATMHAKGNYSNGILDLKAELYSSNILVVRMNVPDFSRPLYLNDEGILNYHIKEEAYYTRLDPTSKTASVRLSPLPEHPTGNLKLTLATARGRHWISQAVIAYTGEYESKVYGWVSELALSTQGLITSEHTVISNEYTGDSNEISHQYQYAWIGGKLQVHQISSQDSRFSNTDKESNTSETFVLYDKSGRESGRTYVRYSEYGDQMSAKVSYYKRNLDQFSEIAASNQIDGLRSKRYYFTAVTDAAKRDTELLDRYMNVRTVSYFEDSSFRWEAYKFRIDYMIDKTSAVYRYIATNVSTRFSEYFLVQGEPDIISDLAGDASDIQIKDLFNGTYRTMLASLGHSYSLQFGVYQGKFGLQFYKNDGSTVISVNFPAENKVTLDGVTYTISLDENSRLSFTQHS